MRLKHNPEFTLGYLPLHLAHIRTVSKKRTLLLWQQAIADLYSNFIICENEYDFFLNLKNELIEMDLIKKKKETYIPGLVIPLSLETSKESMAASRSSSISVKRQLMQSQNVH